MWDAGDGDILNADHGGDAASHIHEGAKGLQMGDQRGNDHAGANETSIVMAVRPELVDFGQVKENESNLIGIAGRHPVRESSAAYGNEILEYTMKTLISGIEKEYKILKES